MSPSACCCASSACAGVLFESNAIARYVARIRRDTELLGRSFFESGQVRSRSAERHAAAV